jgi:hypothetical protein
MAEILISYGKLVDGLGELVDSTERLIDRDESDVRNLIDKAEFVTNDISDRL